MPRILTLLALLALSGPAVAAGDGVKGDAVRGETVFNRCRSCHALVAPDGRVVKPGGKTGPNLYAVIGRPVAATGFDYGPSIRAVGATGAVWTEAELAAYVANPAEWLKTRLADAVAESRMSFMLREGGADVAAYLASVSPAP